MLLDPILEQYLSDTPRLESSSDSESQSLSFFVTFLIMMLFFFITGAAIEKYKPRIGHETCATLLLGILISWIIWGIKGSAETGTFQFKSGFFFNFFLPPIIFNSGFNMRKKRFFANLGNVGLFGLVVTLMCFAIFSVATVGIINGMDLQMYNYSTGEQLTINISTMKVLLFTALLCSSDVVAAVSIVSYKEQPKLYSCIFGEGVFNDIVSIILFNTVEQLQTSSFFWYTPFQILGQFLMLGIISLLFGMISGFITSLIFKHARFLTVSAITETFIIFCLSMISYFLSDLTVIAGIQMSGIISLLTCGIIQSHYTWYNLSP